MYYHYLTISGILLVFSVLIYPLTGKFINFFWKDAKEEAEMVISDDRSKQVFAKNINITASLIVFLVSALFSIAIFRNSLEASSILKMILIMYFAFIAIVDYRTMILPDLLNYIGLWLGLLAAKFAINPIGTSLDSAVMGAFGCYMACWLIIHIGYRIFKAGILGHGDAKYLAMLGAWFGFKISYFIFLLGLLISLFYNIFKGLYISKQAKPVAFGPFLMIAAANTLAFHSEIVSYLTVNYPTIFG